MEIISDPINDPPPPQVPAPGEKTGRQGPSIAGYYLGSVPGFSVPMPGTYYHYRRMACDPTIALAKLLITGPILAGAWTFESFNFENFDPDAEKVSEDELKTRVMFIQKMFQPLRWQILQEALRYFEFGWRPFEKIWDVRKGMYVLKNLKGLLPDLTQINVDSHGNFAGVSNADAKLDTFKSCIFTYDGEAGNLYGRARYENVRHTWSRGEQIETKAAQLCTKAAAIIPQIHYPDGTGQDENGKSTSNFEIAKGLAQGLSNGQAVVIPNMFHSTDDARTSAELAGKSAFVISFLEATGAAAALAGLTDHSRYYDALKLRGMLVPERSAIEATKSGSRADSGTGADAALIGSELMGMDIAGQLSRGVVDDVLELNYGPEARGSVYITAAPLKDEKREIFKTIIDAVLDNAETLGEFLNKIDAESIADALDIPRPNGKKLDFSNVSLIPEPTGRGKGIAPPLDPAAAA